MADGDELKPTKLFAGAGSDIKEEPLTPPLLPKIFTQSIAIASDEKVDPLLQPNSDLPFTGGTDIKSDPLQHNDLPFQADNEVKPEPLNPEPIRPFLAGTPSPAIATYDYFDIAEGTGIVEFEAFYAMDRTASYALLDKSSNTDFSKVLFTTGPVSSGTFAKTKSVDFDLSEFNTPRTIKGNCFVKLYWIQPDDPNNYTHSGAIVVHIKKVNDSGETTIATASGAISVFSTGGSAITTTEFFKLVIPQTNFKIGEQLRLGVDLWSASSDPTPESPIYEPSFYHNPAAAGQELLIKIPFKLNLQ